MGFHVHVFEKTIASMHKLYHILLYYASVIVIHFMVIL